MWIVIEGEKEGGILDEIGEERKEGRGKGERDRFHCDAATMHGHLDLHRT